jgi:indolepyruvate ferredoxin oxidoreductase alpha subunit
MIGCPAISFPEKNAVIDEFLCVGCGVCADVCAFNAITMVAEGEDA